MSTVISKALTSDNFDYDMTDGFRMGVEKEWHKIAPLAPLSTTEIYDLNGNKLDATNYGISIWIKAVVPLSNFEDSGVTENDCSVFDNGNRMTLINGTPLGVPLTVQGTESTARYMTQLDMLRTGLPTAYAKPTQLNTTGISNSAFAEGRNNCLANIPFYVGTQQYKIFNNEIYNYMVASNGDDSTYSIVPTAFIQGGVLSYTIDMSNLQMKQTDNRDLYKYVIPELFTLFGQVGSPNNNIVTTRPCWFLICLGVDKVE